ncbi:LOW QUALITY PROTEIN: THAP domain-containing protein 1-like [Rhopalosiphum maidis]|uniref:LOW QUALITY PROTEIN: THAP domain-containing protein 1-like n=1 Tax=Rhopalosiphum maidis TaxID=43146 RepID=UPI000F004A0F|nr:LOW QUALITY PROTEIN: THAP domain-containing protein 1-like [Rhopalosiphum maidis]
MPVSCAAYGCTNRYQAGQNIHFFRFPISNKELVKKWISAIKRKSFEASQWSRICSVHFTEQDYQVRPGAHRLLLKDHAVPSVFPSFPTYLQVPIKITRKSPTLRNCFDLTVDQLEDNINGCNNMYPVSNFKSVNVQTDTYYPNEEILRNKIEILQQKLRRKNKKIKNLKNLLNNLKNRGLLEDEPQTIIAFNFEGKSWDLELIACAVLCLYSNY